MGGGTYRVGRGRKRTVDGEVCSSGSGLAIVKLVVIC